MSMTPEEHLQIFQKAHWRVRLGHTYKQAKREKGTIDVWRVPENVDNFVGDCDDFAMGVIKVCRDAGVPVRVMCCQYKRYGKWQMHAVAICHGWVSDCDLDDVHERTELEATGNYKWISMSGFAGGEKWHRVAE